MNEKLDPVEFARLRRQTADDRFGRPNDATTEKLIAAVDPLFPSESTESNWLLCETLAWLESPTIAAKAMAMIEAAPTQEEQMHLTLTPQLQEAK